LFLTLAAIAAWLQWRQTRSPVWAVAIGAAAAWATLCRPLDVIAVLTPVAVGMMIPGARQPKKLIVTLAAVAVGMAPFVAAELLLDHRVTGHWLKTPYAMRIGVEQPQSTPGWPHFDPAIEPTSPLPQIRDFYDKWVKDQIRLHAQTPWLTEWLGDRLPTLARVDLPSPILLLFVPAALAARRRGRWVFLASLPMFVGLYSLYAFFLVYYPLSVAPAMIVAMLLGVEAVADAIGGESEKRRADVSADAIGASFHRRGDAITVGAAVLIVGLCVLSLPETQRLTMGERAVRDEYEMPTVRFAHDRLPALVQAPAVVLFKYDPEQAGSTVGGSADITASLESRADGSARAAAGIPMLSPHDEPVFNTDVAWPDDAAIIRAQDLGDRDIELYRYYAARQPDRHIYLFDRGLGRLSYLGTAAEVAAAGKSH
jgi:hypothetical protein